MIDSYTRESGVRNLERKIGTIVRSIAKSIAMEEAYDKVVTEETVRKVLGAEIFDEEFIRAMILPALLQVLHGHKSAVKFFLWNRV